MNKTCVLVGIISSKTTRWKYTFTTRTGIKQGDLLTPMLFNLYLEDQIMELHNAGSEPATLDSLKVPRFLHADDMLLPVLRECQQVLKIYLDHLGD